MHLKKAKGDIIILADQDDIWTPDRIKTVIPIFDKYDLVINDAFIINESDEIIFDSFYKINNKNEGFINNFIKNSYLGCCMAFNRKILEYVLPFPKNIGMHDIWIGLNAQLIGKIKFIDDKLVYYRRHNHNFSPAGGKSNFSLFYKLKYRLDILRELIRRLITRKLIR